MTVSPDKTDFPFVDAALVDALERVFPDRCPDPHLTEPEIRQRIGEVRVVRFLRALQLKQERPTPRDAGERSFGQGGLV